ncbi:MAG: CvpA family protein [Verrucomicrobia bacterium]|nr:CvpA family protein [Verrucomicrobiota bacterium]
MNTEGMATTWAHSVMLAAAPGTNAPAAGPAAGAGLPLNGFDFLLVIILIIGLVVGRKRGMSLELLDVFEWLLIVVLCPIYYQPLGNLFALKTTLPLMYSYMICFAFLAMAIKAIFTTFKVKAGEKVIGSDLFGGAEYYLGMLAGMVRFFCMLLVVLALLNAIPFSEAEVKKEIARRQKASDGTDMFPPFGQIQMGIFQKSLTGPFIRKHLADQLIVPTSPDAKPGSQPSLKERREQRKTEATNSAAVTNSVPTNAPDTARKK